MKKFGIIMFILLVCVSSTAYFLWPLTIVEDVESTKIDSIILHILDDETKRETVLVIEDYNEAQILEYLSLCKERRSLFAFEPKPVGDVEIEIIMYSSNTLRHIILGSINVCYSGDWIKYKVLDADEVKNKLKYLLNYNSYSE